MDGEGWRQNYSQVILSWGSQSEGFPDPTSKFPRTLLTKHTPRSPPPRRPAELGSLGEVPRDLHCRFPTAEV